ncbi:MAG: molybdopterin-dependent oxidoreductase, partial [bacterium]
MFCTFSSSHLRHHHPVPYLSEKEVTYYRLVVDLSALGRGVREFSLKDLKALPKHEVVATLQCSGNRRGEFNSVDR